jgi:P4 family phage/plasmid primase-like protien
MSIQILGIREYFHQKENKLKKKHAFFEENWRAPTIQDLFLNIDKHLSQIPEKERVNLYYTVADCFEEPGRKLKEQWAIPFDVDGIDLSKIEETLDAILHVLHVKRTEVGIVYSGNGIQVIVGIKEPITDDNYFDKKRLHYKAIADKIDLELKARNLIGKADVSVWSAARLMRLPKTKNVKKDKPERQAALINAVIEKLDFSLDRVSELPEVSKIDQVSQAVLEKFPVPDTPTVLGECEFLKHCKADAKTLPEGEWYASLSILGRLNEGRKLAHEYSQGHPGYSAAETDLKLEQSIEASGPRTCKNINAIWAKCATCKHFGTNLVSPIMIRGADYIKTQTTGFHEQKSDANGNPKAGRPVYEDLRQFFEQQHPYFSTVDTGIIYKFIGTHWVQMYDGEVQAFATDHFEPVADNKKRAEFLGLVKTTNKKSIEWLDESIAGKINFQNGYLNMRDMTFKPHDKEIGFRYVLPYGYDPTAEAPRFEKFLEEVTNEDQELVDVLMEFAGYAFSNDPCWTQKAMMLVGSGANGKSTYLEVLKNLAGEDNYSSLMMTDLKDPANRFDLDGKLFNVAEETSKQSIGDTALFKNLITGGEIMIKMFYHQPFKIRNRAKLIFAANEWPKSDDATSALFRRLIIVPFEQQFLNGHHDPMLIDKLNAELPGIFNLVIQGYKRLKKQGKFSHSSTVEEELESYRDETDIVKVFVDEKLEVFDKFEDVFDPGTDEFVTAQRLYEQFINFVIERGEDKVSDKQFFKALKNVISNYKQRFARPSKNNKERHRGLKGVKWREGVNFSIGGHH